MAVDCCSGVADGQKWRWKDKHAVHYLCKLHCKRYTPTWSDKFVLICLFLFLSVCDNEINSDSWITLLAIEYGWILVAM